MLVPERGDEDSPAPRQVEQRELGTPEPGRQEPPKRAPEALLTRPGREDAAHQMAHQKPISADTLRSRLSIGTAPARRLVKIIRAEFQVELADHPAAGDATDEVARSRRHVGGLTLATTCAAEQGSRQSRLTAANRGPGG
jgi:hypothetical protein